MPAQTPLEPHAVLYARYSPRPGDSDSCQKQLEDLHAHCHRVGWAIRGEYSDEGVSGAASPGDPTADSPGKRVGLWEALRALRPGDTLAVRSLDRLARSVILSEIVYSHCRRHGCTIFSLAGEGAASDTAESKLIRQIMQAMAEYQREVIRVRTSVRMRSHMRHGRIMGGALPFGWRERTEGIESSEVRLMEQNPREYHVLEKMRELRAAGLSYGRIAEKLACAGLRTRSGRPWYKTSIRRILARDWTPQEEATAGGG